VKCVSRFDLDRFVTAQNPVYDDVAAELGAGRKRTHWMWFVFPQLRGLGRSSTAHHYGLDGAEEAAAYWRHPVLGPRLQQCTRLVLAADGRSAHDIFGSPDDLKLGSCMTLFEAIASAETPVFGEVLERCCAGERDARTLNLLGRGSPPAQSG
jgi:uncharacterized protein (DUF1810 family)